MSDQQIRSTARNTVMLLAGTLIRLVLTFGFIILAADQMEVAEFGIYCIGVHYFELFLSLAGTAIGILLTREIAKFPKHSSELTTSATVFAVLMAAFAAALLVILAFVLGFSKETQVVLLISTVALFPAAICLVFEAALVAFEKSETIALAAAIEVIIRIGLSVLVIVQGWGLNFLFVVLILSRLIQMLVLGCGVVFKLKMTLNWNFRRTIRFVRRWPTFAAENWMANLYTNLDVLLLSVLSTEVAVGLYSAAWKIIRLGMVFSTIAMLLPVGNLADSLRREVD
ncbi:MAG: oligosaccharide flippase family protein [Planctomycetota bacterium]